MSRPGADSRPDDGQREAISYDDGSDSTPLHLKAMGWAGVALVTAGFYYSFGRGVALVFAGGTLFLIAAGSADRRKSSDSEPGGDDQ